MVIYCLLKATSNACWIPGGLTSKDVIEFVHDKHSSCCLLKATSNACWIPGAISPKDVIEFVHGKHVSCCLTVEEPQESDMMEGVTSVVMVYGCTG